MNRRDFLRSSGVMSAGLALSRFGWSEERLSQWRTFDLTTRIEVLDAAGPTRVWVPAALTARTPYQRTERTTFTATGGHARLVDGGARDGLAIVSAVFPAGVKPVVSVTSRVATRDIAVDMGSPHPAPVDPATLDYFRRATSLLPTGGIVKATADTITRQARTDSDKARAIYDWIVENTHREPTVRGCGIGDIRFMLESKDLAGKCADLNALFVGLARAAGLPARDVYGIRAAKSAYGYKSLGAGSETVTKAQHCRAEVYLADHGWVPVDPADVRKVMLEEPPGNRPPGDDMVVRARQRLFGSWEMNWIAFNFAHDVALPGSTGAPLSFLMYPQAETDRGRIDCLDPDRFRYEITAHEVAL
jgi:transglutaminase-like putative cysteine protease